MTDLILPIFVAIVWLNAQGHIVARASGAAPSTEVCAQLAEKKIADDTDRPEVKGLTPKFQCWDTRTNHSFTTRPAPEAKPNPKPAPGSVQL
jgi:hypothetical protein